MVTVILGVVSLVFHAMVPEVISEVNTEVPQSFTTVTTGIAGVALGAAVAVPGKLVHPFIIAVTV